MVDNFAESANIQALFHSTELTGVETDQKRHEIRSANGHKIIDRQKNGYDLPMLDHAITDLEPSHSTPSSKRFLLLIISPLGKKSHGSAMRDEIGILQGNHGFLFSVSGNQQTTECPLAPD